MAINQNHIFEDLEGVKCAIVEKNVSESRADFLTSLLEYNGFSVIKVISPPPKTVAVKAEGETIIGDENKIEPVTVTYTVAVTDVTFNSTNAIFGRLLHSPDGKVVSLAYWQQKEIISTDAIPYYENKELLK